MDTKDTEFRMFYPGPIPIFLLTYIVYGFGWIALVGIICGSCILYYPYSHALQEAKERAWVFAVTFYYSNLCSAVHSVCCFQPGIFAAIAGVFAAYILWRTGPGY
jgi:hypothetical protein